ncbi:MAG: hypothetical protein CVV22_09100 [Ignavibacteriae bacterium HGW-Ignavibacteriae-1]|jgi:MtrB/PioB family decaheme-associated outer membrane protein|nr:MAG: hypothetical protein CVV22_09100 [Ignavibacteriae bacterium HGW-Ignavibacteriae-1]
MNTNNTCILIIIILLISLVSAKSQESLQFNGQITPGIGWIDLNTNSSKFYEYRDMKEGFYIPGVQLNAIQPNSGFYLQFGGKRLLWDDQVIRLNLGDYTSFWNISIDHKKTPNRLSNKAMTPYSYRGDGVFNSAGYVGIIKDTIDANGTVSLVPTKAQMHVNDSLVAQFLEKNLLPIDLGTQRNNTSVTLNLMQTEELKYSLTYMHETKTGKRNNYGTLGDRPPRTLNVQLPEPVDYTVSEVLANAEYQTNGFQARFNYTLSSFSNQLDFLRWDNIFFTPDTPNDYITTVAGTPRNASLVGQRALAPDNISHYFTLATSIILPFESRLTATGSIGMMSQNENLLPYSYSDLGGDRNAANGDSLNWNDPNKLPINTASAKINTMRLDFEYLINPFNALNLKAYARYYKLDNQTPINQWRYVTQDVATTDGDVSYVNYRRNLAHGFDNMKFGIDLRYYLNFWRTSIGLGAVRENINREYREANTGENIINASLRTRPMKWLSLSAGYLMGDRQIDEYNYMVTSQSYWYSFERGANQVDNPQFLFANHPDLRKYDVSDRKRNKMNVSANLNLLDDLDLSASFTNKSDDFDSQVTPVAPFANTLVPLPNPEDKNAMTPGKQLGLLKDNRQNISINLQYVASEWLTLSMYADQENAKYDIRGMVYNENLRNQPSSQSSSQPTQLGPWNDPNRLYMSNTEEITNSIGLGVMIEVIPGKLRFSTDANVSMATVDMIYSGYGSDPSYLGRDWETFDFGFNSPGKAEFNQYVVNASVEYKVFNNLTCGLHFMFNQYEITDWIQEPSGAWVEFVESENFLRDTSRDNRWGNRLVSLGSYLAPGYTANAVFLNITYMF